MPDFRKALLGSATENVPPGGKVHVKRDDVFPVIVSCRHSVFWWIHQCVEVPDCQAFRGLALLVTVQAFAEDVTHRSFGLTSGSSYFRAVISFACLMPFIFPHGDAGVGSPVLDCFAGMPSDNPK